MNYKKYINFNTDLIAGLSILLLLIITLACNDGDKVTQKNKDDRIGIVLIDKAIMRVDPMLYSSVITYINKGEIVIVLNRSREKDKLGNSENYWYNIRFSRGFVGWIYGDNIKIFPANKSSEIKKFLSEFWESEMLRLRKKLSGRWSIIETGESDEENLEIFDDGKYRSYRMESEVIEGEYVVNLKESKIIFKNGTYFGSILAYSASGSSYLLRKTGKDKEIKIKKVSSKINNAGGDAEKGKSSGA